MDELAEALSLVEEVNDLIQNLQDSLRLFKDGNGETALEKINSVEKGIEDLREKNLAEKVKVEDELSAALASLEWISDHADRVKNQGLQ